MSRWRYFIGVIKVYSRLILSRGDYPRSSDQPDLISWKALTQSWEFPKEEEILPVNRNVSPYLRALAALPDNLPYRFWISLVSPPSQISQLLAVNLLIYASCCFYFSGYSSTDTHTKEKAENTTCWALKNCLGTVTIAMSFSAISISKGLHKWESGWNCGVGGKRLSMLLLQGIHTPWKCTINSLDVQ